MTVKYLIILACLYSVACATSYNSCGKGLSRCYSGCVDLSKDNANCGKCGYKCPTNKTCTKSNCVLKDVCAAKSPVVPSFKDRVFVKFEHPPYSLGVIDGQDHWTSTGAAGAIGTCAKYDHAVAHTTSATFKSQSLRISNAVTSGCFTDQTFAKPLTDSVGETSATAKTFPVGTRRRHLDMQFDIMSAVPTMQQPDLFVSVSPDRGDGSRMSYLGFQDSPAGIDVIFYDVQGTSTSANFVSATIATGLDRTKPHRIRLTLDAVDGPSNDVVKVYIDCKLVKTGTSWENYYRYDSGEHLEQSTRLIKTVLFRTGGTTQYPSLAGYGFFFDNLIIGAN